MIDDQEAGAWVDADDKKLATSDAIIARHDAYIRDSKPPKPTYEQPGKNWQNTEECYTTYWNSSANAWVAYVNTGPRGIPGQDGTDGTDGEQGPQGPTGEKGDKGDGLFVTGYIDQPGPPTFDGTSQGDLVIDSEGHGWFWETDVDPAAWVDLGTIRGPEGPQGPSGADGSDGADGAAATVAVGTTTTGQPGTEASVVNTGTTSASILNFTIPRGEKGDQGEPGRDGTGAGAPLVSLTTTLPVTVDLVTDPAIPHLALDISALLLLYHELYNGTAFDLLKDGDVVIRLINGQSLKGVYRANTNTWEVGELPEEPGVPGPQGPKGDQGEKGDPGQGLAPSGIVDTYDNLPPANDHFLQFWLVDDTNTLYFSDGTEWKDLGSPIQGPQGDGLTSITANDNGSTYTLTFAGTVPSFNFTTPNLRGANGTPGKGWYDTQIIDQRPTNYQINFLSNDGLGFTTDNIMGAKGDPGDMEVAY